MIKVLLSLSHSPIRVKFWPLWAEYCSLRIIIMVFKKKWLVCEILNTFCSISVFHSHISQKGRTLSRIYKKYGNPNLVGSLRPLWLKRKSNQLRESENIFSMIFCPYRKHDCSIRKIYTSTRQAKFMEQTIVIVTLVDNYRVTTLFRFCLLFQTISAPYN